MDRACRFCGCTETRACVTPSGPCGWLDETACDAPLCRVAAVAELQLRFALWCLEFGAHQDRRARWRRPIELADRLEI